MVGIIFGLVMNQLVLIYQKQFHWGYRVIRYPLYFNLNFDKSWSSDLTILGFIQIIPRE